MPISIQNDQIERLASQLAELTGETLTEAIRAAVVEKYERLNQARAGRSLADDLNEIGLRCAKRPIVSHLLDEEILGYNPCGAPTK